MNINFVASSSKLLRARGFETLAEAEAQAAEWAERDSKFRDLEAKSTVYTWAEWCAISEAEEADPLEGLENG